MSKPMARPAILNAFVLLAIAVVWQIASLGVNPIVLPSFTSVVHDLYAILTLGSIPRFPEALGLTVLEILSGFLLAAALAFILAVGFSLNRVVRGAYHPVVLFLFSIPHIILFPVFIVTFGLGPLSKVAFAALSGFPVMTLGMLSAFTRVEKPAIDLARSMGAGTGLIYAKIVMPYSLSGLLGALRVGLGTVAVVTVVAEVLGSTNGLGYYLRTAFESFQVTEYFALAILIGIVVMAMNLGFSALEARTRRWAFR